MCKILNRHIIIGFETNEPREEKETTNAEKGKTGDAEKIKEGIFVFLVPILTLKIANIEISY